MQLAWPRAEEISRILVLAQDFSKNQFKFKFSLGSGSTNVILRNLEVDPGYLQTLIPGLPFEISKSTVDYVKINVSIAHINTQPMEIEIGNLVLEVREPVEILPYKDLKSESSGSVGGSHKGVPKGQTMGDMVVKEGPGGPYVKAKKKSYTTVQKVWHGASWNIKRVQVLLYTLGQDKSEEVEEELRPPALEILLDDIKFHSTDEHWRKSNLKESREYSNDLVTPLILIPIPKIVNFNSVTSRIPQRWLVIMRAGIDLNSTLLVTAQLGGVACCFWQWLIIPSCDVPSLQLEQTQTVNPKP